MLTRPPPGGGRLLPSDVLQSSSNDDWRQPFAQFAWFMQFASPLRNPYVWAPCTLRSLDASNPIFRNVMQIPRDIAWTG